MPFSEKSLASITLTFFIKVSSRLRLFGSAFKETLSSAFSKSNPWPKPKFLPNRTWETGLGFLVDLPPKAFFQDCQVSRHCSGKTGQGERDWELMGGGFRAGNLVPLQHEIKSAAADTQGLAAHFLFQPHSSRVSRRAIPSLWARLGEPPGNWPGWRQANPRLLPVLLGPEPGQAR